MIPGLGVNNEWDYVKFSQGNKLGEMEIFIWSLKMDIIQTTISPNDGKGLKTDCQGVVRSRKKIN